MSDINRIRLLHRISLVIVNLAITQQDLEWIFLDQATTGVINLSNLPLADSPTLIPPPLGGLINLADLMRMHHSISTQDLTLLDIMDQLIHPPVGGYNNSQFSADLITLTEWTLSDLVWLTGGNVSVAFPPAYETAAGWRCLTRMVVAGDCRIA